jgi:hypothetical protein
MIHLLVKVVHAILDESRCVSCGSAGSLSSASWRGPEPHSGFPLPGVYTYRPAKNTIPPTEREVDAQPRLNIDQVERLDARIAKLFPVVVVNSAGSLRYNRASFFVEVGEAGSFLDASLRKAR